MDATRVQHWLPELVATQGARSLRDKGIVDVAGDPRRLVFELVHMILEGDWQQPWRADERRHAGSSSSAAAWTTASCAPASRPAPCEDCAAWRMAP